MNIFYSCSEGRADVSCEAPIEASYDAALAAFRALDPERGFMGIVLNECYCLQLYPDQGGVRIELLDTSKPAFDAGDAAPEFAESLIRAAFDGQDVFEIARRSDVEWEHTDLRRRFCWRMLRRVLAALKSVLRLFRL